MPIDCPALFGGSSRAPRLRVKAPREGKLVQAFGPDVFLGTCNPPLAHRALSSNPQIGMLLPCNVVVEEHGQGSLVSIINPEAMISVGGLGADAVTCDVASEARARLERGAGAR